MPKDPLQLDFYKALPYVARAAYLPVNLGGRFSMKARIASLESS
jgi:hypothetical protein